MRSLSEILTRDTESEIIPSEIYGRVIEAARKKLIGTQLLALRAGPESIPGKTLTVVTQTVDSISVHRVAEGAEVPIDVENYSSFDVTPVKYGVRPVVTKEMQEDGQFDVIQRNLEYAGYKMAEKLDELILEQIESGSDATGGGGAVSGGSAITISNIAEAMYNIENNGYMPTDFIVGPATAQDIRQIAEFVHADKSGVTNVSQRLIGTIFGMKVWVSRNINNALYAYVIDRDWALMLGEKRPITIEKYDDVTRDLSGIVFTARWKARYLQQGACSHIELS